MKVYCCRMDHFDGDHRHGFYESPFFLRREDAEAFRQALIDIPERDDRLWWTDDGNWGAGPEEAYIEEIEVLESWDGNLKEAKAYLHITYT